jgi:hypothetical protein
MASVHPLGGRRNRRCLRLPELLGGLSVLHNNSVLYGGFVWARSTLNSRKWRFSARAEPAGLHPAVWKAVRRRRVGLRLSLGGRARVRRVGAEAAPLHPLHRPFGPTWGAYAAFSMAVLSGRAGRLITQNDGFRPGQWRATGRSGRTACLSSRGAGSPATVRARLGHSSAISVFHSKSGLIDGFVWARRALNIPKRRFAAPPGRRRAQARERGALRRAGPPGRARSHCRVVLPLIH